MEDNCIPKQLYSNNPGEDGMWADLENDAQRPEEVTHLP